MVVSGALSLESALLLVARRAQLMASKCHIGESTMLACNDSTLSIKNLIAQSGLSQLIVACDNSATDSVISGPVDQVEQLACLVKGKGIPCKRLDVPLGFHSSALDAMLPEFKAQCEGLSFSSPSIPLGSCFHGRLIEEGSLDTSYPVEQTRGLVRFTELIDSLFKKDGMQKATFVEVGPNPVTLPMIRVKFSGQDALFLPSIAKGQDPWVSISRALQQMSLRYDSIQWRNVFDGTDANIVDLPDYPFLTHSLYVPFKEISVEKPVLSSLQAPRPSAFHILQGVVEESSGKGLSTFSTSLDALSKYIEGHSVNGFPLCPASVYYEMVLEAMHHDAAPVQDQLALVSDITFGHPLVYSSEMRSSTVMLALQKSPIVATGSTQGKFTFLLPAASSHNFENTLCSGRTAWMSSSDAKAYLARKAAYAKKQIELLQRNKSQINTLHRGVIYNTVFPRVVTYSEPYQSITELHVSEAHLDGYGTFKVPASTLNGGIISPVFVDTMLHAAGFVANSQAKRTDAFICSKVESSIMLYTDIKPQETFHVYCSLLDCGGQELIGEAFAMTPEGIAVASIEGMVFKRLNLKSFAGHLSRYASQQSSSDIPRSVVSQSKELTRTVRSCAPDVSDTMSTVISLISKLCEQPREAITPDKRLANLGIDSLMQIELSHSLKNQFPHLDSDGVMDLETVQDIQSYVSNIRASQFGVVLAREEPSNSSSEHSDDSSTSTMSGNLTPYTEPNITSKDVTNLLVRLVADTCGFYPSDVRQDTAFEALGMDSLMAIEFRECVQREFGKTLGQEILSPTLTISELAAMLAADISLPSSESSPHLIENATDKANFQERTEGHFIVHLQQGPDNRPPMILFHDGSGLIENYKSLPKLGCQVFGIRNGELTARPHWARNLKDMANRYATLITSIVKAKRVVLGGKFPFEQSSTGQRCTNVHRMVFRWRSRP